MSQIKKPQNTPGNTNLECKFRGRAFQFTCNSEEIYIKTVNYITKSKMLDYIISCRELAPTTGHEHFHIYAHFDNPRIIKAKKIEGAHIEICRGSAFQNIEYIKKNGEILIEEGIAPTSNCLTISELKKITDPENLPDWKQYNLWKQLKTNTININNWNKKITVYYISGDSGVGKSLKAKELVIEHNYEDVNIGKYENGYWNNVNENCKCLIYDDFRDSHMPASEFINMIDYNIHPMNIKGGHIMNNYELIIITSIQKLENIYSNMAEEPKKQWVRRIINLHISSHSAD